MKLTTRGFTLPEEVTTRQDIIDMQKKLGVAADGIWGPKTDAAYKNIQPNNGAYEQTTTGTVMYSPYPSSTNSQSAGYTNYGTMNQGNSSESSANLLSYMYKMINSSRLSTREMEKARYTIGGMDDKKLRDTYYDMKRNGIENIFSQDAFEARARIMFLGEEATTTQKMPGQVLGYAANGFKIPDGITDVFDVQKELGVKVDGIWGKNTDAAYRASMEQDWQTTFMNTLTAAMDRVSPLNGGETDPTVFGDQVLMMGEEPTLPWSEEYIGFILNHYKGLDRQDLFTIAQSRENKDIYVSSACRYLIHQGKVYSLLTNATGAALSAKDANIFTIALTRRDFDWGKALLGFNAEDPLSNPIYAGDYPISNGSVGAEGSVLSIIGGLVNSVAKGLRTGTVTIQFCEGANGQNTASITMTDNQPSWYRDIVWKQVPVWDKKTKKIGLLRFSDVGLFGKQNPLSDKKNRYDEFASIAEHITGIPSD
ncbi:hypothetical protein LJC42_08905, partial [Eubacteriales bacterium OttesenSCG-928-K08]|nr:hypothetical protein [Eubacteriales bacterium OttesenSCG-928-K08]